MAIRFFRKKDREDIHQALANLQRPVQLLLFISHYQDEYSNIAQRMLAELVAIHPQLELDVRDLAANPALARALDVQAAPVIAVRGGVEQDDYNLRFYGLPGGSTFPALLEAIIMVGEETPGHLRPATQSYLEQLSHPLSLRIFVTAIDDTCPAVATLAYKLALASPYISADVIEILAFPHLARHYAVRRTPTIVINQRLVLEGEASELYMLDLLQLASAAPARGPDPAFSWHRWRADLGYEKPEPGAER